MRLHLVLTLLVVLLHCTLIGAQTASSPTTFSSISPDATTITLTWTQPPGEVVDQYVITYSFEEVDCGFSGSNIRVTVDGSLREHNLTGLEENSDYMFSIIASNGAGDSPPATTMETTTPANPSAPPPDLMVMSTTPTSITITWGRIPCEDRNVEISEYIGRYGPNLQIRVFGTNNRVFAATGLVPSTSYTFELEAFHLDVVQLLPFQGPPASVSGTTAAPASVGFFLNGVLYPNNSVVALTDIGEAADIGGDNTALFCLTDLTTCCRGVDGGSAGEWFLAGQTEPVVDASNAQSTDSFTRGRGSNAVRLNRVGNAQGPTGIYTCQVPDGSGLRTAYIGVNTGSPQITELVYDMTTLTLTCTSTGGIVDSVTWRKDGLEVESEFSQMQTITDTVSATYQHTLSSDNIADFVGSFTCEVRDAANNMDQRTQFINGVTVSSDQFIVGQRAVVTCSSDSGVVEMIEWQSGGQVVASATSVQQLQLVLDPVNDTVHGSEVICFVTRGANMANQSLSISVTVPPDSLSATVDASRPPVAGSEFSMDCIIVEDIPGLTNMPTAMWLDAEGTPVTTGGDITIAPPSRNDTVAVATATFDPLRASHGEGGVRYMCAGSLMSPALNSPVQVTTEETLTVQIPAPAVTLSVPPGPLYAGGVEDTTLTCSAMLDLAVVDTQQDIFYTFTWRDRAGVEIVSGDRITISQTASTPSLTLSPLSVMDTSFTCTVAVTVNQGVLVPSDPAMASTTLDVLVPDPPEVDIARTGPSTAGGIHTLTCTVTLLQPLRATPTIMWMNSGGVIDNDTLVNVTVSTPEEMVVILTFDPLRTSHGDEYLCVANVEVEDGLSLMNSSALNITVRVDIPAPTVTITASPVQSHFYTGLQLNLTCRIQLATPIGYDPSVSAQWSKSGSALMTNSRVSVGEEPVEVGPFVYSTSLVLSSLDKTRGDEGDYTCTVTVTGTVVESLVFTPVTVMATQVVQVETPRFQLKLLGVSNCENWKADNPSSKDSDIVQAIVNEVVARCGCDFTEDRITERSFQCFASSPEAVTYRAVLHGTREATVEDLLQDIEQWVQEADGVSISVQSQMLEVDGSCDARISSSTDMECRTGTGDREPVAIGPIVGAVAGVIAVVVVLVVITIIAIVFTKKRVTKLKDTTLKLSDSQLHQSTPLHEDVKEPLSGGALSEDYKPTTTTFMAASPEATAPVSANGENVAATEAAGPVTGAGDEGVVAPNTMVTTSAVDNQDDRLDSDEVVVKDPAVQ